MRRTLILISLVAALCVTAAAVTIPSGSVAGPIPASPGTGLNGQFWDAPSGIASTTAATTYITDNPTPTATFLATLIDYPAGGTQSVGDDTLFPVFISGNSSGVSGGATSTIDSSVYLFSGFIVIRNVGDTVFSIGSDDGFRLTIGGVILGEQPTDRGFANTDMTGTFSATGLYPIQLLFYEDQGSSGIEFRTGSLTGPLVPTADLFTSADVVPAGDTPEPATALLLIPALGGLFALRRRF